ncbi:MAG TPA: NYN domain-containing protein [Polyangiaceae bacterium]|nr:NYN domain-containing protein [Polyangiaceae bacterium]
MAKAATQAGVTDSAPNIAIFCDYENVALGARDARFDAFDIQLVLERLLDKGKIVVKKAYSDWDRYKSARRPLHEAGFELIEIPHVSYSGKNSADIRLVVDALDLCSTKSHVDVFVVVSGDSDFSPLVSKLRENDKTVIGIGVKNSSSDLLIESCDEFILYDDLVRGKKRDRVRSKAPPAGENKRDRAAAKKKDDSEEDPDTSKRRSEGIELVLDIVDALFRDRDDSIWGSMVKQTLKRKRPSFNESFHGYRSFNELLEDAETRGLLELQKDERSGGYIIVGFGPKA